MRQRVSARSRREPAHPVVNGARRVLEVQVAVGAFERGSERYPRFILGFSAKLTFDHPGEIRTNHLRRELAEPSCELRSGLVGADANFMSRVDRTRVEPLIHLHE